MNEIIDHVTEVIPTPSARMLGTIRHIRFGTSTGTAVILSTSNGQCWATAQHVISGAKDGDTVDVDEGKWKPFPIVEVIHSAPEIDGSVFTLSTEYPLKTLSLERLPTLFFGQTLVAYGFPYGHIQPIELLPFPNPLCKRGTFSGVLSHGSAGTIHLMDAIINPGFSGGPVICWEYQAKEIQLAGIVCRAHPELSDFGRIVDVSDPTHPAKVPNLLAQIYSGYTILIPPSMIRELAVQLTTFPKSLDGSSK